MRHILKKKSGIHDMNEKILSILADENDRGTLTINVVTASGSRPVENARIQITETGQEEVLYDLTTDAEGKAGPVSLNAPPLQYSLQPDQLQPYSEYTVQVDAEGFTPQAISNIQILPDRLALLTITLFEGSEGSPDDVSDIAPHTLYFEYPPKIPEAEIKPVTETGEIVLSSVVVPEYIVVHDGPPDDRSARNYYVRYKDYIKNVASSEIYATWPTETIRANILAIMSFTLNRVYTEWYRSLWSFTVPERLVLIN